MHTVLLSRPISPDLYSNILTTVQYRVVDKDKEGKFFKCEIRNNLLTTLEESERASLPHMYLFRYEKDISDGSEDDEDGLEEDGEEGLKRGNKLVFFMFELCINFRECLFGKDGYKSIPAGSMAVMVVNNILELVDKAIPILNNENEKMVPFRRLNPSRGYALSNYEIPIWPELERIYKKLHPEQSNPGRAGILKALAVTENKEVKEIMKNLFMEPEVFACPDLDEDETMRIFNSYIPTYYSLKRIDYNLDIYTEYKEILLHLVSMGYGMKEKVKKDEKGKKKEKGDPVKVYKNEVTGKIESYYIELPSYHINIYDKYAKLVKDNEQDGVEEITKYLLRFEVQLLRKRLSYEVDRNVQGIEGMTRELKYFLTYDLEHKIMDYFLQRIIGKGNYYTYTSACKIVENSNLKKGMKEKLCRVLEHVAECGSIRDFLKCVDNGKITDCKKLNTAKNYLKILHKMNVNPVTISSDMQKQMKDIEQKIHVELLPNSLQYPQYRYGIDFLYNPLVYLEINNEVWKKNREMGEPPIYSYISSVHMGKGN